ncbi:hypothetical protein ABZP36_023851 [Zizania latifolia]
MGAGGGQRQPTRCGRGVKAAREPQRGRVRVEAVDARQFVRVESGAAEVADKTWGLEGGAEPRSRPRHAAARGMGGGMARGGGIVKLALGG